MKFDNEILKQIRVKLLKPCHLHRPETEHQYGHQAAILKMINDVAENQYAPTHIDMYWATEVSNSYSKPN